MDRFIDKLNYHTSIENKKGGVLGEPWFPKYHTSLQSSDIAFDNLKKINNKLDDNNVIALAYLANNPYLTADERDKYSNKLKDMAMKEYHQFRLEVGKVERLCDGGAGGGDFSPSYINDIIHRNENSSADITERND